MFTPKTYCQDCFVGVFSGVGVGRWVLIEISIKPNLLYGNSAVHFKCTLCPGIYWLGDYSTSGRKENKLLNKSGDHWNAFTWQSSLMCRELFSLWFKWRRRFFYRTTMGVWKVYSKCETMFDLVFFIFVVYLFFLSSIKIKKPWNYH